MDIKPYHACDNFNIESVKRPNGYDMKHLHYHKAYELYFLEEGYHGILAKNRFLQIFPQDVALFSPNVLHKSQDAKSYNRTCIYFTEEFLKKFYTQDAINTLLLCFEKDIISLNAKSYFKAKKLLSQMQSLQDCDDLKHIFIPLGELLNLLSVHKDDIRMEPTFTSDEKIRQILEYLSDNYQSITNLDKIAEHFNVSITHLCRVFKKHTNMTIIQYINHLKIQHSCDLLSNTQKNITEISFDCGFNSTMYFCKIFKTHIGCTPKEFRNNTK